MPEPMTHAFVGTGFGASELETLPAGKERVLIEADDFRAASKGWSGMWLDWPRGGNKSRWDRKEGWD